MPTGPEHYKQAEQLVAEAMTCTTWQESAGVCAIAQVHATLALAAAAARPALKAYYGDDGRRICDKDVFPGTPL